MKDFELISCSTSYKRTFSYRFEISIIVFSSRDSDTLINGKIFENRSALGYVVDFASNQNILSHSMKKYQKFLYLVNFLVFHGDISFLKYSLNNFSSRNVHYKKRIRNDRNCSPTLCNQFAMTGYKSSVRFFGKS